MSQLSEKIGVEGGGVEGEGVGEHGKYRRRGDMVREWRRRSSFDAVRVLLAF